MKSLLALLLLMSSYGSPAQLLYPEDQQEKEVPQHHFPKRRFGLQFFGPSIVAPHFEYAFYARKYVALTADVGLGVAEYSDDSFDPPTPATHALHTAICLNVGYPRVQLVGSVFPSTYFNGPLTFINLNGLLGLRLNGAKDFDGFMMIGYTPRLYTSLTYPDAPYPHFNMCVRIGARLP